MPGKKSFLKKAAPALLVLLLSISGSMVMPQDAASQLNTNPKKYPPGTKFTPQGIPYDEKGMKAEYGPDWRKVLEANDKKLADFYDGQKKRLQGAQRLAFSEDRVIDDVIKVYPFLKKDLLDTKNTQTKMGNVPVRIAESLDTTTRLNLLFINIRGPLYCGSHGCGLDVYVDNGTGYKKALDVIAFDPVHVSRADGQVSLFFGLPERNGKTPVEWVLRSNSFEASEPPEVE